MAGITKAAMKTSYIEKCRNISAVKQSTSSCRPKMTRSSFRSFVSTKLKIWIIYLLLKVIAVVICKIVLMAVYPNDVGQKKEMSEVVVVFQQKGPLK